MSIIQTEGPENALMYLHDAYDDILHKNSIKYLQPPCSNRFEHSLDVKQDTWLAVFRNLKNFRHEVKKPLPWLLTINRNECFAHLRSYIPRDGVVLIDHEDNHLEELATKASDPLEELVKEDNAQLLRKIVSELPVKDQKILQLFSDGVPHQVISTMLGISLTTSRQILCRALGKLKRKARGEEI